MYDKKQYDKKCGICEIKYEDCECSLEYKSFKEDLIEYKCLCCNKNYKKRLMRADRKFF